MPPRICAFGTTDAAHVTITIDDGEAHVSALSLSFTRSLWFDQDIDGRWLVWSSAPGDGAETGAIVVRDPAVTAFLDELAQLLASPQRFTHEPHFDHDARRSVGQARATASDLD